MAERHIIDSAPLIYHGTPMTPRGALQSMAGRAFCVSFWRPESVEVVEAISPAIMFRQRRFFGMEGGTAARRGIFRARGLDALLRLVRGSALPAGTMGGYPGRARSANTDQRRASKRVAVRSGQGGAALAYGRPDRSLLEAGGQIRPGLHRLDRSVRRGREEAGAGRGGRGLRGLFPTHGRIGASDRQSMACDAHDARDARRSGISVHDRRQHQPSAERSPL